VNNTHLSSRVGRFNLDWTDPDQSSEKENEAFHRAMALAGSEFLDVSIHCSCSLSLNPKNSKQFLNVFSCFTFSLLSEQVPFPCRVFDFM
jgi:hypothetical protein